MYSQELLDEVTDFAYKYLLIPEISTITDIPKELFKEDDHPVRLAFLKGRYLRKAEFNGSLITLSKQLSSPAMAIEHKVAESTFLNDSKNL
jgi:hypothetical protein